MSYWHMEHKDRIYWILCCWAFVYFPIKISLKQMLTFLHTKACAEKCQNSMLTLAHGNTDTCLCRTGHFRYFGWVVAWCLVCLTFTDFLQLRSYRPQQWHAHQTHRTVCFLQPTWAHSVWLIAAHNMLVCVLLLVVCQAVRGAETVNSTQIRIENNSAQKDYQQQEEGKVLPFR